ncbi:MAG: bifunctional diaminohydroxyphosphoribosylaminopyrimidine deaminase/5-amino-6-(5-phosphoribosylamino)uracil reductase RibD [Bacteroidota bacterium]|nr:bifunctional diaminohydroxyphosphoribosylaminopyrimidine deaminase/5-amino-6-(5-phosphoribosylamino)uracil reductase RibD [Bacteroidota bacterium]
MQTQEFYMQKCFELAYKGIGNVSPNPMVGSIIVYNNKIIGQGYHQKYGFSHAEVNAIASVKNKGLLNKSTLYVNLEPCAHFGKTPPCANLIIKQKIPKVVIGCIDASSKVSGKGIKNMQEAGIEVVVGVLEKESQQLNKKFFTLHKKKRPYIILKWAESKDGFIAPNNQNESFWMTSYESKKLVHKWRAEEDAILVGRITAEKDNPSLTVREVKGDSPIRIVIDKDLKLSKNLNLFNSESETIIFNNIKSKVKGINTFVKVDFRNLINNIIGELYKQKIQSIIIEGGTRTIQSFIDVKLWDEARIFTTNKKLTKGLKAPIITGKTVEETEVGEDKLTYYKFHSSSEKNMEKNQMKT